MPFTPLHIGPGAPVKAAALGRFSITVFGLTQVAIDLEVLWHLIRRDPPLHGFWHSYAGAMLIAGVLTLVGKPLSEWIKGTWNLIAWRGRLTGLRVSVPTSWTAAFTGAVVGATSHVLLDSLYHGDIEPFRPWSAANPFSGMVDPRHLEVTCIVLGIAGLAWVWGRRMRDGLLR